MNYRWFQLAIIFLIQPYTCEALAQNPERVQHANPAHELTLSTPLKCVVMVTRAEHEKAPTAVEFANRGDRDGLLSFVRASQWRAIERDSTLFVLSSEVSRIAEGMHGLEAEILTLFNANGVADLTDESNRQRLSRWAGAVFDSPIPHLASARRLIETQLHTDLKSALYNGLSQVELFGRVCLTYAIPEVEGQPVSVVGNVSLSPKANKQDAPLPRRGSKQDLSDIWETESSRELTILASAKVSADELGDILLQVSQVFNELKQQSIKNYHNLVKELERKLGFQWRGLEFNRWYELGTLSEELRSELHGNLQNLRPLFESMGQPFPESGLPSEAQVSSFVVPTIALTLQYEGRRLVVTIEMNPLNSSPSWLRAVNVFIESGNISPLGGVP